MPEDNEERSPNGLLRFFGSKLHLLVVLTAGAIGGILATPIQILLRGGGRLTEFNVPSLGAEVWIWFTIFGCVAAFLSVYLIANAKRDNLLHLTGLALAGGIAFPAVFADTVSSQTIQSGIELKAAKNAVESGGDPAARVATAEVIATSAIEQIDTEELGSRDRDILSKDVSEVVRELSIANDSESNAAASRIVDAARAKGLQVDQLEGIAVTQNLD